MTADQLRQQLETAVHTMLGSAAIDGSACTVNTEYLAANAAYQTALASLVRLWRHPPATHPDARDAARYRWLRAEQTIDPGVVPSLPWTVWIVKCAGMPATFPCRGDDLDTAIDRAMGAAPTDEAIRHGVNCPKAPHYIGHGGYLHQSNDDGPYYVDGVAYCGRCHYSLDMGAKEGA